MTVYLDHRAHDTYLAVDLSGKLHKADYERFVPEVEKMIREYGKVRLLVRLSDFEGWDAAALWEDIKFDMKHFRDIEKLAIVGETKWQEGMAMFCKPFTSAKIQYFHPDKLIDAESWLEE